MSPIYFNRLGGPAFLFLFPLLALCLGFVLSYQQDQMRVSELGRIAWLHFLYAEELKDDMAVIDWSKNLEKLGNVRAFEANVDSKTVAGGGNRDFLLSGTPEGVSYHFPSEWSYHVFSAKEGSPIKEFILVCHSSPGPLLWALFSFFASCLSAAGAGLLILLNQKPVSSKDLSLSRNPSTVSVSANTIPSLKPHPKSILENIPFLFLDKQYVIQEVSPQAGDLLGKNPQNLAQAHILDLSPSPQLLQALEKAEETKIPDSFSDHPGLSVHLKPDPNGFLLILEGSPSDGLPKKR